MRRRIRIGIYCIQNKKNNKIYIGSSRDIRCRFAVHRKDLELNRHNNTYLQRSYNKYGKSSFLFKIVEITTKSKLIKREQYWIDKYNSYKKGYNICPIAYGSPSLNPEVVKKISKSLIGFKHSEKSRMRMSLAQIGKKHSEEHINKRIKSRRGYKHSEETKGKTSESHKGKTISKESRMKHSKTLTGRKLSEETKRKISESNKLAYKNGTRKVMRRKDEYAH